MGAEIYFTPDKESEERFISEHGKIQLPPLPEPQLFGIGAYPLLLHGVSCLASELRAACSDTEEEMFRSAYLALIEEDRDKAIADSDRYLNLVRGWLELSKGSTFTIVTPGSVPVDGLLTASHAPDARVFWGKLLFLDAAVTNHDCDLVASATLWVFTRCELRLAGLSPEDEQTAVALRLTQNVMQSLGLHAMYVRRYGGEYCISI